MAAGQEVLLALGGNLGPVVQTFLRALCALETAGVTLEAVSRLYCTAPLLAPGAAPQPPYLNAVVRGRTLLLPRQLLRRTQAVERALGRHRTATRWAARTIDIDVVNYAQICLCDRQLSVPHPRAHERLFVLAPLLDVSPCAHLAGQKQSAQQHHRALVGQQPALATYLSWPRAKKYF